MHVKVEYEYTKNTQKEGLSVPDNLEFDFTTVDHNLSRVLERHGDAMINARLNLAQSPIGIRRIFDQHARFKNRICAQHSTLLSLRGYA